MAAPEKPQHLFRFFCETCDNEIPVGLHLLPETKRLTCTQCGATLDVPNAAALAEQTLKVIAAMQEMLGEMAKCSAHHYAVFYGGARLYRGQETHSRPGSGRPGVRGSGGR